MQFSLWHRNCAAVLRELNPSHSLGSGRTGLYNSAAQHLLIATTTGEGQQRYGEEREEERKDTVTERVLHQHHEITCSEADHCFLQEKTLIRLL